jgi:hypothetical protein
MVGPVGILLASLMDLDTRAHILQHIYTLQHVCTVSLLVFLSKKRCILELHLPDAGYPGRQLLGSSWFFG